MGSKAIECFIDDPSKAAALTSMDETTLLRESLRARASSDAPDYWSFRGTERARDDGNVLFQYPAMMVSPMQGALIDVLREHKPGPIAVLDPFVGSGTTLIEAMRRGLTAAGTDLNPLAVMLARVESAEATSHDLPSALAQVRSRYDELRGELEAPTDKWTTRWFRSDVAAELAALSAAIRSEEAPELRRLWWSSLAEVVRLSSNARLSTPKIQNRPSGEIARPIDVRERFGRLAKRAVSILEARSEALARSGHLSSGCYWPGLTVELADARSLPSSLAGFADVVLTSPPYGDNHTTMPYGQASFLPLLWIDVRDTAENIPGELLESSRSLDTLSLGGSRLTATSDAIDPIVARSPSLARLMRRLEKHSHEAWQRVGAFFVDYATACDSMLASSKPDAHLMLTLGDRTVRGEHVPTASVTEELFASRGVRLLETLHRAIPRNKRIASRNESSKTIGSETVLILKREGN
jgi:hypothetical protein